MKFPRNARSLAELRGTPERAKRGMVHLPHAWGAISPPFAPPSCLGSRRALCLGATCHDLPLTQWAPVAVGKDRSYRYRYSVAAAYRYHQPEARVRAVSCERSRATRSTVGTSYHGTVWPQHRVAVVRKSLPTMRPASSSPGSLPRSTSCAPIPFFCGAGQREMCLSGFLRFCDAFLARYRADKVEEIRELRGRGGPLRPRTRALCGPARWRGFASPRSRSPRSSGWSAHARSARLPVPAADAEKRASSAASPRASASCCRREARPAAPLRARAAGAVATGPHVAGEAPSPQTKPRASPPRSDRGAPPRAAHRPASTTPTPAAAARARGRSPRRTNGDGRPGTPATGAAPAAHTPRPPPRPRVVSPREGMVPHPPDQRPPTPVAGPTQPPPARRRRRRRP